MERVPFEKPALDVEHQLRLLRSRGLEIRDPDTARQALEHIGYYRFSGYTLPFQKGGSAADRHTFKAGTTFETVLDRYVFDRKLRLVLMDAVERIEISIRASLSNSIALRHSPNWYENPKLFDKNFRHDDFIRDIKDQIGFDPIRKSRRDIYIQHYYDHYNKPELPPCWMVFESISFGTISIAFKNLAYPEHEEICRRFQLPHHILSSWLHSISYIRNLCAHHSRLWNRVCTLKPFVAKRYRLDLNPNDRLYAQLVVMQVLLKTISPGNHWARSLFSLIESHKDVPLDRMGIPDDWASRPLWALRETS